VNNPLAMDSVIGERGFISLALEKLVDCIPILSRWTDKPCVRSGGMIQKAHKKLGV
jgi:hypothetical protein